MSDETKQKAREAARAIRETGESAMKDAREAAASTAGQVKEAAGDAVGTARARTADQGERLASALHQKADGMEPDSMKRRVMDSVAGGVESVSSKVRDGSLSQLVADTEDFARRNPVLFIAGAALAGFAIARMTQPRGRDGRNG